MSNLEDKELGMRMGLIMGTAKSLQNVISIKLDMDQLREVVFLIIKNTSNY